MSTHTPTEFLKVATHTAEHFGFKTVEQLKKSYDCKQCTTSLPHTATNAPSLPIDATDQLLTAGLATFCEERLHAITKPVLFYNTTNVPDTDETAVSFHIFNVSRSIGEAILIQVTRSLATDLGHADHVVRINSLGDADSLTRYSRELTTFLRKRLDTMPVEAREFMKLHPLHALAHLVETNHDLAYRSPNPLEYLSDPSRKHFREIVEYLDMSETPYEIDPKMLGRHEYYSDALFTLDFPVSDVPSALSVRGGRFDEFAHRHTRTRTPVVGAVVVLKDSKAPSRVPRPKNTPPAVYVVQLGFGPKIKSLLLIERLRQAGIPVMHNLASDSLSTQLREAEAEQVRYTVIIGQKEFVDGTVILRDMNVRNQEFIPVDALIKKLKRSVAVAA